MHNIERSGCIMKTAIGYSLSLCIINLEFMSPSRTLIILCNFRLLICITNNLSTTAMNWNTVCALTRFRCAMFHCVTSTVIQSDNC